MAGMLRPGLIASAAAIGLAATLTLQAVVSATCQVAVIPRQARPNIVVVVFDDLEVPLAQALSGWRAMEERGATFDRAVVTSPLCCPSRVSILTGKYAHNHGVIWNAIPNGGHKRALEMGVEHCTVAVWLQQAGYTTALMGKYLNGYGYETPPSEIPDGWDRWAAPWKETSVVGGRYVLDVDGRLERPARYQTDELASRAVRFMSDAERARTPFFLYLAPAPPHRPWIPPARYATADTGGYQLPDRYRTMLAGLDLVRRVIAVAPQNTYFILTSDNGYHLHPTPGKAEPRWVDVNVPFVVLGPSVAVEARDELVANIDIAPTIADWAGITPPPGVDGSSLVPLLAGGPSDWRDEILTEMVGSWRAIVTRTEMRIHWAGGGDDVIDLR